MISRLKNWCSTLWKDLFALFKRGVEAMMPLLGMPIKPFYDKSDFPWLQLLEDNYAGIKKEMLEVYHNTPVPSVISVNKNVANMVLDEDWKIISLWVYGNRIDKNCSRCPFTESVVRQIPGFHSAFFSILEPGKNIAIHRGVYRGNTLAHLGLVVPEPHEQCKFYVGDACRSWEEGKAFVFEDSYDHYVENTATSLRVVLIVEFRRKVPFLLRPFDAYIQKVIFNSYITKNIVRRLTR